MGISGCGFKNPAALINPQSEILIPQWKVLCYSLARTPKATSTQFIQRKDSED
jgi:hypothetical protein